MIKTIICDGCGIETKDWDGYPDDELFCRECYNKRKISYIEHQIDDIDKQRLRLNKEKLELQNKIKSLLK